MAIVTIESTIGDHLDRLTLLAHEITIHAKHDVTIIHNGEKYIFKPHYKISTYHDLYGKDIKLSE